MAEILTPSYDDLKDTLTANTCIVYFAEEDGKTKRNFRCTLNTSLIPETAGPAIPPRTSETTPRLNAKELRVWDLDNEVWQTVNMDSVFLITTLE